MSTRPRLLLLLIAAALTGPAIAPGAGDAASRGALRAAAAVPTAPPLAARGFRGRGYGGYGSRYRRGYNRYDRRAARRRGSPNVGRFFGNVLRWLGVAYLFHLLFGWGPGGGSPFGLLLLLVLVGGLVWLVRSSRRRRERWYRTA